MAIKIDSFAGIAPKISNRKLPQNMGQIADNCRLVSGNLTAFADKLQITSNTLRSGGDVKTIFRMNDGASDHWLSWIKNVNVARGQIAGDTAQRIYWTGDNEPRMTNLALAIAGGGVMPNSCFVLGVSAPLVAPTVTPSGGVGAATSRAYVETFVTPFGEESAPSPVTAVISGKVDDTWALTALNAAPINSANITGASVSSGICSVVTSSTAHLRAGEEVTHAGIVGMTDLNGNFVILSVTDATHYTVALTTAQTYTSGGTWARVAPHNTTGMTRRIYRSLSGSYFFVAGIAVATTSYNDTIADSALGETLPSIGWDMPPADMTGLIALPNGGNAGFIGNEVCFADPYHPHAWPVAYRQGCNFEVVALGAFGSSVVVGTKGVPYIIIGSHPSSMSMEKTEVNESCLSALGMVDVGVGVMFPSANGMPFIGVGGADMGTKTIYEKDAWKKINPSTLRCKYHGNMLFGWHDIDADLHTGFVFDLATGSFASTSLSITTCYVDDETNNMYVVSGGAIYQWDAHPYNELTFDWKSKMFAHSRPVNYGFAMIDADFGGASAINDAIAADLAWNTNILSLANAEAAYDDTHSKGTLDASMLDEYMLDGGEMRGGSFAEYTIRSLRLIVYVDGTEKYTEDVVSKKSFSLPGGFKSDLWEFRLSGNIPVYSLAVSENALGLRNL
jgi:hypothetical protein